MRASSSTDTGRQRGRVLDLRPHLSLLDCRCCRAASSTDTNGDVHHLRYYGSARLPLTLLRQPWTIVQHSLFPSTRYSSRISWIVGTVEIAGSSASVPKAV